MSNNSILLPPFPPYKNKVVTMIPMVHPSWRKVAIREAGYNTFLLKSRDVIIDLLTDSGTNAMYDTQKSAMELGDEAYAGSESFFKLESVIKGFYGANHLVPTHQGRAAEHLVSKILVRRNQYVLSNMYFTTSRAHVEAFGGLWKSVSIKEAKDPDSLHPFKGNIDLEKLESLAIKLGPKIAFIRIEACLNMAGGQPFSMENLSTVKLIAQKYGIPLVIDATRAIENCYFIKKREAGFADVPISHILFEICKDADWIVVSAKKDAIVNIGGFLCMKDSNNFEEAKNLLLMYEGFYEYGGLSGRAMEAIAEGLRKAIDEKYIEHRVEQTQYFGNLLLEAGIPIVRPVGGHGVYLNAEKFLPHIPQSQFTAQALAAAIYEECGIRGMERGLASAGRDPKTGKEHSSDLELVRLTIPRLVYHETHFAHAAKWISEVYENRERIRGLKMVYEPKRLRFFGARFELL